MLDHSAMVSYDIFILKRHFSFYGHASYHFYQSTFFLVGHIFPFNQMRKCVQTLDLLCIKCFILKIT